MRSNLFAVIIQFTVNKTALVADMKQDFCSVRMNQKDHNKLRFPWVANSALNISLVELMRSTKACFQIISSMGRLGTIISHNLNEYKHEIPRVFEITQNLLYINDLPTRAGTTSIEKLLYIGSKTLIQEVDSKPDHEGIRY